MFHFKYQVDPVGGTRAINTVQPQVYSHSRFSAISLNSIVIMAAMNVESKVESGQGEMGPGQHLWPYLLMIFRFLSRKGLRFMKRCLTAMQEATPDDQA